MSPSRRAIHADESEALTGYRVWHIALDAMSQTRITVTWKVFDANVIEGEELREMMFLSQTPEIFAGMVLERVEEIVAEPMPAHVSNGLRRELVHWYNDNWREIAKLLVDQNSRSATLDGADV